MAEDWFARCAEIVSMDVTGPPSHVRLVPNEPDVYVTEIENWSGTSTFIEPPDADDESTDTNRTFVVEVHFDAETDLEALLATSAITGFVRRRLKSLNNVVVIGCANNPEGVTP